MRPRLLGLLVLAALLALLAPPRPAAALEPLPTDWQRGVSMDGFWWRDFDGPRPAEWLRRARDGDHVGWVTFATSWYQWFSDANRTDELNADEIHSSFGSRRACAHNDGNDWTRCKTPSIEAMRRLIEKAQGLGLHVAIKPLVDVGRSPDTSQPRAGIDKGDDDRRKWFDSYKFMLSQYARLARDTGADTLVVGTGLTGMTNDEADLAEWRAIVADIRSGALMGDGKGGFRGTLTFGANWNALGDDARDPLDHRFFWDALDEIGIEAYFPLVKVQGDGSHDNPTPDVLAQGWNTDVGGFGASPTQIARGLHAEYGKPVIFTGLGYLSRGGTTVDPSQPDAVQARNGGKVNQQAQQRPYAAAYDVWTPIARDEGWFKGIWWWDWPATGRVHRGDGSYTAQGKAAEVEMCRRDLSSDRGTCTRSKLR